MKRLKIAFSVALLLLALPFWRFADVLAIASPFNFPLTIALILWFAVFITLPIKLIAGKIKVPWLVGMIACFGALAHWSGPTSHMATTDPNFSHCGKITYTGFFYPFHNFVSEAHRDDLEARNQMCWIRKMISRVPEKFDGENEVDDYTKIIQERLFKPEIKYRVSLPLIAVLYARINMAWGEVYGGKKVYDSLHFWIDHYTDEISNREYSAWNWPHSSYIKFEYGLVETNWQSLVDSIVIESK